MSDSSDSATRDTAARWRSYLPMDCPLCGRRRLEYRTNADGNVIEVQCEKCGASSKGDAFSKEDHDD